MKLVLYKIPLEGLPRSSKEGIKAFVSLVVAQI